MPNYHCSISVISRSAGRSSVAAVAYRAGVRLVDERQGIEHDYTRKQGVVHSEITLPAEAPERWHDRSTLWNEVEQIERSGRAQLAREFEVSLPRELSRAEQIELTRSYVDGLTDRGMVADWSIHDKGYGNPHAHIMTTMRSCDREGFLSKSYGVYLCRDREGREEWFTPSELKAHEKEGYEKCYSYQKEYLTRTEALERGLDPIKDRDRKQPIQETRYRNDWNEKERVNEWRHEWERTQNQSLERHYERQRTPENEREYVDSRSYEERGIDREPMKHEGPFVRQIEDQHERECRERGIEYQPLTERRRENIEIQERNTLRERIQELHREISLRYERLQNVIREHVSALEGRLERSHNSIAQTIERASGALDRAIEKVIQRPSDNYMRDLATEAANHGIEMHLTPNKKDLQFTVRGQNAQQINFCGKDIGRDLRTVLSSIENRHIERLEHKQVERGERAINQYAKEAQQKKIDRQEARREQQPSLLSRSGPARDLAAAREAARAYNRDYEQNISRGRGR